MGFHPLIKAWRILSQTAHVAQRGLAVFRLAPVLLLGCCIWMWVRSNVTSYDWVSIWLQSNRSFNVQSWEGSLIFFVQSGGIERWEDEYDLFLDKVPDWDSTPNRFYIEARDDIDGVAAGETAIGYDGTRELLSNYIRQGRFAIGAWQGTEQDSGERISMTGVSVPYWPVALLLALLTCWSFKGFVRHCRHRLRARQGRCTKCGYDLRASPERCPECGQPMAIHTGRTGSSDPHRTIEPDAGRLPTRPSETGAGSPRCSGKSVRSILSPAILLLSLALIVIGWQFATARPAWLRYRFRFHRMRLEIPASTDLLRERLGPPSYAMSWSQFMASLSDAHGQYSVPCWPNASVSCSSYRSYVLTRLRDLADGEQSALTVGNVDDPAWARSPAMLGRTVWVYCEQMAIGTPQGPIYVFLIEDGRAIRQCCMYDFDVDQLQVPVGKARGASGQ